MTSLFAALQDKLFRWQTSDGQAPIVLTQRRIFIIPTRSGLFYAVVLATMLAGAVNYNLALGHALVFLLAGLGLAGMVHTFRNLAGLTLRGGRAEPVFVGETAHFPLHLDNNRPLERLSLSFQAGDHPIVNCHLGANDHGRIELPVAARQRGRLALPRVRLSSVYPLGWFVAWSYPKPDMSCLVYPLPLDFPLPAPAAAAARGDRHGDAGQEDFAGLRPHQPADSPRHVAWKAVARDADHRPLLVKQFAGGAAAELRLDFNALPDDMDKETRLSVLTGWVLAAEAEGLNYGLALPGVDLPPACGDAHARRCLEALALTP